MATIDPAVAELAELMLCRCGRPTTFVAESFVCPGCRFESGQCECEVVEPED